MDQDTLGIVKQQLELNRAIHRLLGLMLHATTAQQTAIVLMVDFMNHMASSITGEALEKLPALPSPEELARQAAEIEQLRKIFELGSGLPGQ